MSDLSKRRMKVEALTRQALIDRQPHKYMQGRFILEMIDQRERENLLQRIKYITKTKSHV